MSQFATEGPVDETLTFLSNTLQIRNEDGSLTSPIEGEITWLNKYSNENDRYIFLAEDIGRYITDGRNLYQFTDEGTPQLRVQQDSDVTAKMLLLDGAYENYDGPVLVSKQMRTIPSICFRELPLMVHWVSGCKRAKMVQRTAVKRLLSGN